MPPKSGGYQARQGWYTAGCDLRSPLLPGLRSAEIDGFAKPGERRGQDSSGEEDRLPRTEHRADPDECAKIAVNLVSPGDVIRIVNGSRSVDDQYCKAWKE